MADVSLYVIGWIGQSLLQVDLQVANFLNVNLFQRIHRFLDKLGRRNVALPQIVQL